MFSESDCDAMDHARDQQKERDLEDRCSLSVRAPSGVEIGCARPSGHDGKCRTRSGIEEGERQLIPTVPHSLDFETKRLGATTYHRFTCAACSPKRIGTWLLSAEKVAENAAMHTRWHREGCP